MPAVSLLIKPSSSMCNLRCRYCFYEDEANHRELPSFGFMKEETLECILKKTLDYAEGECTIAWQGGEPTLIGLPFFEKAVELIARYHTKNLRIHHAIQTNGYHLGEDWAAFFAKNHFLVGLSLDGSKDTHNAFRLAPDGSGTFFDVLETKDLLEQFHVDYNILTVVNARTAKKARKLYDFYKKYHMSYLQFIPCLDPLPAEEFAFSSGEQPASASDAVFDFSLTAEAYGTFLNELFDCWYEDAIQGRAPYIRSFENYIGILAGYPPEACDQRGICGIQHVVEADGSVYPCDFYVLDHYRLGNLVTDHYADLEAKRKELRFQEISREQILSCQACRFFSICRGGCRRHRTEHGKNRFCSSYQSFFAHTLDRMQQLARRVR